MNERLSSLSESAREQETKLISIAILENRIEANKSIIKKYFPHRHSSELAKVLLKSAVLVMRYTLKEINLLLH